MQRTRLITGRRKRRLVLVVATLGLIMTAVPAWAAAPTNDTFAGATVIGAIPFTQTLDTTQATTDANDVAANANCGAPATEASVWYSFTAATDRSLLVDVSKSSYSAGVIVVTGAPGSFNLVACGPGATGFFATAGQTYYLLAFSDTAGVTGGQLKIAVKKAPPPPTVAVTVDALGSVSGGVATVSGSVSCSGVAEFGPILSVRVSQDVGRFIIHGRAQADESPCDGSTRHWSLRVNSRTGRFSGGHATVNADAFACGPIDCGEDSATRTLQLHH